MKHDHSWLNQYTEMLQGKIVLELGCGSGVDTQAISRLTDSFVAGDLSPELNNSCNALLLDHSKTLPFAASSFDTVVASLCLHYFKLEKTSEIIREISRVLKSGGQLLCRVNSIQDENYGASGYPEIEPGLYEVNGEPKRFFTEQEIQALWSQEFVLGNISHKSIDRYQKKKFVYEFSATKA